MRFTPFTQRGNKEWGAGLPGSEGSDMPSLNYTLDLQVGMPHRWGCMEIDPLGSCTSDGKVKPWEWMNSPASVQCVRVRGNDENRDNTVL